MRAAAVALLALAAALPAAALETDQYAAWGRPLEDAAAAVDAWFTRELDRTLAGHGEGSCWDVTRAYQARLRFAVIFHPPEVWAGTSGMVDRYPATDAEWDAFAAVNLYADRNPLDVSLWMPISPTIEVGGVRLGTDKLAHFVSLGWHSYRKYRRLVARGVPPAEAERRLVRWALVGEKDLLLGYRTSGVLSLSDLEADVRGLEFYRDLCGGPDPVLERRGGRWVRRRPVRIERYVTPEWDESYEPQILRPGKWRRVRRALLRRCAQLEGAWVRRLWRAYAARDGLTVAESVVLELAAEGRLPDPGAYEIEAVCGLPPRPLDLGGGPGPAPDVPEAAIARELAALAGETPPPRRPVALHQLGWSRPLGASVGAGALWARVPRAGCREMCDLRGPFLEAVAGAGGAEVGAGWAQLIGSLRGRRLEHAYLAVGGRVGLLRTWGAPVGAASGVTHATAVLEFSVARVNLELGTLWPLEGPDRSPAVRWAVGFGF